MKRTRTTAWALEIGLRLTLSLMDDGRLAFVTLRTGFDPFEALGISPGSVHYVTDAAVGNLAARHGIKIMGDAVSAPRLLSVLDTSWREAMTLDELAAHKYLGGFDVEQVLASYATDQVQAA